jgi:hypothetical protein
MAALKASLDKSARRSQPKTARRSTAINPMR